MGADGVARHYDSYVLSSQWLEVELVPELGGRVVRISAEAEISGGLKFSIDPGEAVKKRLLSHVQEDSLWLFGLDRRGVSYHLRYRVLEDRPALAIEVRLLNRTYRHIAIQPYFSGEAIGSSVGVKSDGLLCDIGPGMVRMDRALPFLEPRASVIFTAEFIPVAGVLEVIAATEEFCVGLGEESLVIGPEITGEGFQMHLRAGDGQTLAASANLRAGAPLRYPFSQIGGRPKSLAIRDAAGNEMLACDFRDQVELPVREAGYNIPEDNEPLWALYQSQVAYRHVVAAMQSKKLFLSGDFENAGLYAEQELLYNGDQPLAWIEKGVASRHDVSGGDLEPEDGGELANAHYLAPLEPLLRCEAFLRASGEAGSLLEPLRRCPELLLESACFYLERGLYQDAGLILQKGLELAPCRTMALLLAASYLRSGLKMQAVELVWQSKGYEAEPLPSHFIEWSAIAALAELVPGDDVLAELNRLRPAPAVSF